MIAMITMVAMMMIMTFMMTHISLFIILRNMINRKSINVLLHSYEINDICNILSVLLSKGLILLLCIYSWLYLWKCFNKAYFCFSISIFILLVKITSCFSQISCFLHFYLFLLLLTLLLQKFGEIFTITVTGNSFHLIFI